MHASTSKPSMVGCSKSGTPLLIVPVGSTPTLRPKKVLLAWDSRIEAARAAHEAIDLLVEADDVNVTLVDPEATFGANGPEPGADIATYLARHGVKVTVVRLSSAKHSVADALRQHAVDISADLIVMGAYGHSRLRERIFGGVTKSMIQNPPCLSSWRIERRRQPGILFAAPGCVSGAHKSESQWPGRNPSGERVDAEELFGLSGESS